MPRSSIIVSDEPLSNEPLPHRVRCRAEQPAPGRFRDAPADGDRSSDGGNDEDGSDSSSACLDPRVHPIRKSQAPTHTAIPSRQSAPARRPVLLSDATGTGGRAADGVGRTVRREDHRPSRRAWTAADAAVHHAALLPYGELQIRLNGVSAARRSREKPPWPATRAVLAFSRLRGRAQARPPDPATPAYRPSSKRLVDASIGLRLLPAGRWRTARSTGVPSSARWSGCA